MSTLVVVANRLPVEAVSEGEGAGAWAPSPGGLVAALRPIVEREGGTWVGWPGPRRAAVPREVDGISMHAVRLRAEEVRDYYDGFSNGTLWPLYHRLIVPPVYRHDWWSAYVHANERFAEAADKAAPEGALVWVHDYHLQLVPALLRERRPDLRIGFFMHVPFPAPEIFGQLPWRRPVLEGVLGAHVVGFQTPQDVTNFRASVDRWVDHDVSRPAVAEPSRRLETRIDSFPISVDFARWSQLAADPEVEMQARRWRAELGRPRTVLLGIDRLDYTKGIDLRLAAFRDLLRDGRVEAPDTVFVQVATPSRDRTASYRRLRERVERLVGEINGDYGQLGAPAVHYIHRALQPDELPALYKCADVMLVTSIADGMNLVAKEFVACRGASGGVLVLSEFAGAANELRDALIVNPHDSAGMQQAIVDAIRMSPEDVAGRMGSLRNVVARNDIHHWAETFLATLQPGPIGRRSASTAWSASGSEPLVVGMR